MLPPSARDAVLVPEVREIVLFHARRLRRSKLFRIDAVDDLARDLTLALLRAMPHHDSKRGAITTFADRVVRNAAGGMIRARGRLKRESPTTVVSLSESVAADDGFEQPLADTIVADDQCCRLGVRSGDVESNEALANRVRAIVAELPDDLRTVCVHLMEVAEAETARRLQTSRRQIRAAKQRILRRFLKHDFGDFG